MKRRKFLYICSVNILALPLNVISNLQFESKVFEHFPCFYKKNAKGLKKYFIAPPITSSCILS